MLPPCHSIAATANGEPATASAVITETSSKLSDVKHSVFAIGGALTCCFFGDVPLLHTSMYVIACTSLHVTQFYHAFHHISTASNKCWGEKAWVRG